MATMLPTAAQNSQSTPVSPTTPNSTTMPFSTTTGQSAAASLNSIDRQFAMKAAQSDITEIQTSQLALNRSQNPQILKYAQEMIQAHTDSTNNANG